MMNLSRNNQLLIDEQLKIKEHGEEEGSEYMKQVYREHKKQQDETIKYVAFLYATYAVSGLFNIKKSEKEKILNKSDKILVKMGKDLSKTEVRVLGDILRNEYKNTYYRNNYLYELGGMNINFKIQRKEFIDAIVNAKFKGENFSSRIYSNKADLINSLKKEIENNLKGKTHLDEAVRNLKKQFNLSTFQSERLFGTELCRIQSIASDNIAREAGIEKQMFTAVLDHRTSAECRGYDGMIFDINDSNKPIPPLHPFCRSCLVSITDSWTFNTKRRDNITKELIDYKKYDEWLADKGVAD